MDAGLIVFFLFAGAVGLAISYFVIRGAVISGLKHHAVWKATGGLDAEVQLRSSHEGGIARE